MDDTSEKVVRPAQTPKPDDAGRITKLDTAMLNRLREAILAGRNKPNTGGTT